MQALRARDVAALASIPTLLVACDRLSPPGEKTPVPKPSARVQTPPGPVRSATPEPSSKETNVTPPADAGVEVAIELAGKKEKKK